MHGLEVSAKITKLLIEKRLEEGHILAFSWVLVQNFLDLLDLYQLYRVQSNRCGVALDWHRNFISSWNGCELCGSSHGGGVGDGSGGGRNTRSGRGGRGAVGGRGGVGGWFGLRKSANLALGWSQGLDGTWLSLSLGVFNGVHVTWTTGGRCAVSGRGALDERVALGTR